MTREKSIIDVINEAQHAIESLGEVLRNGLLIHDYLLVIGRH